MSLTLLQLKLEIWATMKSLKNLLLLVVGLQLSAAAMAGVECREDAGYTVRYAVQPSGQKYWIAPDREFVSTLPVLNMASEGELKFSLTVKRVDDKTLIAEMTLNVAPREGQDGMRSAVLLSIKMDQVSPTPFAGHITDSASGSVWGLSLVPTCGFL